MKCINSLIAMALIKIYSSKTTKQENETTVDLCHYMNNLLVFYSHSIPKISMF